MSLRKLVIIVSLVLLAGCNPSTGNSSSSASGAASAAPASSETSVKKDGGAKDIVAPDAGVTLGSGWYPYETYRGQHFRWVNNDAQIVVQNAASSPLNLSLDVEPGPGLGAGVTKITLLVNAPDGSTVAKLPVTGRQTVSASLPVQTGKSATFALRVAGGGTHVAGESRLLNFRVFRIARAKAVAAGPDIVADPNVTLGNHWFPLEHFKGETFRWVDNDAQLIVNSKAVKTRRLKVVAAAGPSIVSPANFIIELRDKSGQPIQVAKIKARGTAYLELPLAAGANSFTLHVASTGRKAPNDPRVLDFRVFSLSVE